MAGSTTPTSGTAASGLVGLTRPGTVTLRWSDGAVTFPLALAHDEAFEWFVDVTDLDPSGPHAFLWEATGEVEAPCAMAPWQPLLGLLGAPRPTDAATPDPQLVLGLHEALAGSSDARTVLEPARIELAGEHVWCRRVGVEVRAGIVTLAIVPLRGHPLTFPVGSLELDADGSGMTVTTPLGAIEVTAAEPSIAECSRFPELWRAGPAVALTLPPPAVGKELVGALWRWRDDGAHDPERLEILVPRPDEDQAELHLRHVIVTSWDATITMLHGSAASAEQQVARGRTWRPVSARAATEVRWHPTTLTADMVALAADPAPEWRDIPPDVRRRIGDAILARVAAELHDVGCLGPWTDERTPYRARSERELLRTWIERVERAEDGDGTSLWSTFLDDDSGWPAHAAEASLLDAIQLALHLRSAHSASLPGLLPEPLDVLKVVSWLESRIDPDRWEWDLQEARERWADDHFEGRPVRDEHEYVEAVERGRWFADWPGLDDEDT